VTASTSVVERVDELATVFADQSAFRRWYDVAVVRVYRYLHGRCAGDIDLAEELTQQTFMQAIRHWREFDGRADSITWLCAIARNQLIDHYRRLEREERRHLRLVVQEISMTESEIEVTVDQREAILHALRHLPAVYRAALLLRYVDEMSVQEVATALGKSVDATDAIIRRARDRFRAAYPEASDA
jgi:RNA polymerase sigma-70 factor (ECF subfamily)